MDNKKNFITEKIEEWSTIFFYGFSVFILCLITQGVILTLANIFFLPWVLLSCLISFAVALLFLKKTRQNIQTLPKLSIPIILFTSIVVSIIIFFPHDTIGGRDESAYSNMAVYLAQKGTLNLPEHLKSLPGNYAEGLRSRLPAYTVWLGTTYVIVGLDGLFRANVLLVTLGLLSFFLTVTSFSNRKIALTASVLLGSSMPFLWFMRDTMTENLFFFVLWFAILSLITYIKNRNVLFLIVVFLSSLILSLTRIEGVFIMGTVILAIIIYTIRTNRKNIVGIVLACGILITASFLIIKVFGFSTYFLSNMNGAIANLEQDISIATSDINQTESLRQSESAFLYKKMPQFSTAMLHKYNYVIIIFSILLLSSAAIFGKKNMFNRTYFLLIIFIILPEFYKIISPSVTLDQPWFYRRYIYALLPVGYFSFVILLQYMNRWIGMFIFSFILIINIVFSSNILFLKNNWTLTNKLDYLSTNISKDDMVMIRSWTLGYYYPASYLIIQKNIRATFLSGKEVPELDLVNKNYNGSHYERLFLLSTNMNEAYPDSIISTIKSIDLSYKQLIPLCQTYEIGIFEKFKDPYDFNLISYDLAASYCAKTTNNIEKRDETLYLHELTSR